jgi:hypothetical protein
MTTITKTAKPALAARTWALAQRGLSHIERLDTLALGVAFGIAVFGPGIWLSLMFLAPYVAIQLALWALFRTRKGA